MRKAVAKYATLCLFILCTSIAVGVAHSGASPGERHRDLYIVVGGFVLFVENLLLVLTGVFYCIRSDERAKEGG